MTPLKETTKQRRLSPERAKEEKLDEAVKNYALRKWSLGKASEYSGLPPEAMMNELSRRGILLNIAAEDISASIRSMGT